MKGRTRKRTTSKRVTKRRKTTLSSLSKKVNKALDKVVVKKWFDQTISLSVPTGGTLTELANIPAWDGTNLTRYRQREGLSCQLKSLSFKGIVQIPNSQVTPNDANNRVRVILVSTKETVTGVTPSVSDFIQTNINGALSTNVDSYYKKNPVYPYRIWYDRTFLLMNQQQAQTGTTSDFPSEPFRRQVMENIKFGPNGMTEKWATGAVPTARGIENRLWMVTISDSVIPTHPTILFTGRMNFTDSGQ